MSSSGTTPPDLTKVQNQCSLTNHIELIRVDGICEYSPSKFEMVRWKNPSETLQHLFAALSVFRGTYDLYQANFETMKLVEMSFDDLSKNKAIYFAVKKTITCRRDKTRLLQALYNIWLQNAGTISKRQRGIQRYQRDSQLRCQVAVRRYGTSLSITPRPLHFGHF